MKDLILRISIKNKLFIIFISIFFLFSFIGNEKVYAHQPFFIKSYNKIENGSGIKISDASVSHAFYGQFDNKKQFTLIDLDISDGEDLFVEVLIPNKFPENEISINELPLLRISSNNSDSIEIDPDIRIEFYEPFSKMNLLRIASYRVPAKYNDYSIELLSRSSSPLRFVQSVGYKEIFMRRYVDGDFEESTMQKLNEWYLKEATDQAESNHKLDLLLTVNNNPITSLIFFILIITGIFGIFFTIKKLSNKKNH